MAKIKAIPQYIWYLIFFGMGMLTLLTLKGCMDNPLPIKPYPQYTKTDTVYIDGYIQDTSNKSKILIPMITTIYKHDTTRILRQRYDTIYITSQSPNKIDTTINVINLYPELVRGKFTKDSVNLYTFNTVNKLQKDHYPVDFQKFDYEYIDGRFKQLDNPKYVADKKKFKNILQYESNVYLGYYPSSKDPSLSVDYSIIYKQVGLFTRGELTQKNTNAQVGVKIKLR